MINENFIEVIKYIKKNTIVSLGNSIYIFNLIKNLNKNIYFNENKSNIIFIPTSNLIKHELLKNNFTIKDIEFIDYIDLYIDFISEIDNNMNFIKKNNNNFLKEKIALSISKKFVCYIENEDNKVNILGKNFPLQIEIFPFSIKYINKKISEMDSYLVKNNILTENNNYILDVYNLDFSNPKFLDIYINSIHGVINNGLYCEKKPNIVISLESKEEIF